MAIQVSKVQRASLRFDKGSTVLDLIQALTENLDGDWDDARLELEPLAFGGWCLNVLLEDSEEPCRPSRWETEDGEHVAVVITPPDGLVPIRRCSCGVEGNDEQMTAHMNKMAGFNG